MQLNLCFGCMEETTSNPCPHCGYLHQKQNGQEYALQPGTILHGKYLIGKVLGQGGFGITYIGWDIPLARKVAIKEYFPSAYVSRDTQTSTFLQWYQTEQSQEAQSQGQEMFLKEARKMNLVDSIPQVVHVLDTFNDNGTAYIIMNYVPGENLAKQIARTGPMSWQAVRTLLLPVADVMEQVHSAGLIHRDLSPDNLMIQPNGDVKILDLGASKDLNLHRGVSSMQVAKGGFSPMEQYVMRGNSGPWSDVYSLAATMYFALTGVVPPSAVERMDNDTLRWDLPSLRSVPSSVIHTLQKAMALQVKERIQSMHDFAEELRKPGSGRKHWKVLFAAAAAALAGIVLFTALRTPSAEKADPKPSDPVASIASTVPGETVQEAPPPEEKEAWADNVLLASVIPDAYKYDVDQAPVFGSRIARYQIVSVTFLDSLDAVGTEAWDVSQARDGSVMAWTKVHGTVNAWIDDKYVTSDSYDLYIAAENGINGKYCATLFKGFQNLNSIDFNGSFHTEYCESMENMFSGCANLDKLDVSELKTSQVRNMNSMFQNCPVTELDLRNFDTSHVEKMEFMFYSCSKLKSLDLRSFDTSNVLDMSDMFCLTSALTQLDISSFDTSSVTDMGFMFSFTGMTSLDLSHFDTSSMTSMSYMFSNSKSLKTVDVSSFDTSGVTSMRGVFHGCISLDTLLGVSDWDTSNVTDTEEFMDEGCRIDGQPWEKLFQ